MEIKYIGPKAVISEHGVSFRDGKDDKYVYINGAIQIFKAINHEYQKNMKYNHDIDNTLYSSNDILSTLKESIPEFEDVIHNELRGYKNYLQKQEDEVEAKQNLSKDEKVAFINNLKIMKPYREQRFLNKHVYEHVIQAITQRVVENKLHEIQTPFNERFWHILQTISGWLSSNYNISSTLDTLHDEDNIIIKLHVNKIY